MKLGKKVRKLRKKNNLTIKELANEAGLSAGMISQIERDKIGISVASLWKIAKALNVYIGYFFDENPAEDNPIVRKDKRKKIKLANSNAIYELLTPDLSGKIEFLELTIEPGEGSNRRETISHEGEECGLIIQGKLLAKLGNQEYILEAGDSIRIDSTRPHRYINIGDIPCISVWAITPPNF
ncbi:helix-turn-helix domain-containing protein [Sporohalobacter salinus]|uniref:helix-turn-helix domain-containing protein n=1 Tax=Sporohalobacter salinus TaxID=1494606 RepID=UPI001960A510|nr:XRE family transcriptional regulator [Sporohalobacter salinus]MBM7622807.1 transcriptional regulator with XRE-family HTH domain [Sporohalobacter salinus]